MAQQFTQQEISINKTFDKTSPAIVDINKDYKNNSNTQINDNIFKTVFENATQLIFILNPRGQVHLANKLALKFFNSKENEIIGKKIWDNFFWNKCTDGRSKIITGIAKSLKGETIKLETQFIHDGHDIHYIDFTFKPIFDHNNILEMIILEGTNITNRKNNENYLQTIASHDSLTGLPNERLLYDKLNQAIIRSRRNNNLLAVLFIDLDGFKEINDKYGHHVGDMILQAVPIRIIDSIRENDTVARMGGDEFVVLMEDVKEMNHIITVSERVLSSFNKPFITNGIDCSSLTASIGVSIFPYDGTDAEMLLKKADSAMYQVKNESKNDYKIFS